MNKTTDQTKPPGEKLTPSQIHGLCALIHLAHRESTSVLYQWDEWGFTDIPREAIEQIDELESDEQLATAVWMTMDMTDSEESNEN